MSCDSSNEPRYCHSAKGELDSSFRKRLQQHSYYSPKFSLSDLADELLLEIFELLIVESSVCLGLTCKKLYEIDGTMWGRVELLKPLDFWRTQTSEHIDIRLYDLLQDWMSHDMVFDYKRRDPKFVPAGEIAAREARIMALDHCGYAKTARDDMENVCGDLFRNMARGNLRD